MISALGIGAGVRYLDFTFGDNVNTLKVPGVTLADAALRYDWRNFRLAMNVPNVFDKEYAASCFVHGVNFCTFGDRRIITGGITYRW
jgi:iron complex outermembrane receptor protein